MKKEADVKKRVKEILDGMGAWWFMYVPTGYGVAGVPDFLCCIKGRFFAIETKFGNKQPTALQHAQMRRINAADGPVFVVNEKNVEQLEDWIRTACL